MRAATALLVAALVACAPSTGSSPAARDAVAAAGAPGRPVPRGGDAAQTGIVRELPGSVAQVRLSFAPVVREVVPSVVSITTRKQAVAQNPFADDPFFRFFFRDLERFGPPRQRVETSLGSGVVVREDGIIVTNHHVVAGADEIEVVLGDRRALPARLMASDAGSDLAFLKVESGRERLRALPLGDSDAIEVGDIVLAIGNPFGIGQTVTSGIVSAKERTAPSLDRDVSFIQTDAAINPGNSGGALVTLDGRLIGVNTAIFTRSGGSIGIGFAIPSNLVRARLGQVTSGATEVRRAWLGAALRPVGADVAGSLGLDRPQGVLVSRIHPGSAADRAGLEPGDVVVALDGVTVGDPASLGYRLSLRPLGERARLDVLRRGAARTIEVVVEPPRREPAPEEKRLAGRHPLGGAAVANMSPAFNEQLEIDMFERGVVVLETQPGSVASRLRLRRGDVIESVNGTSVGSVAELERALGRQPQGWQIGVRRGGQSTLLTVPG